MMKASFRSETSLIVTAIIVALSGPFLLAEEQQGVPPLKVVYFTPKDRVAPPDRHERVGRVMKHVQDFYRKGMESQGYGPLTFALEWSEPGKLKLYDVEGKDDLSGYPPGTAYKVRDEVKAALEKIGINVDREHILILGHFIEWKEDKTAVEHGPYVGGGSFFSGTAWACDDTLIDPDLLGSKEPGGYYHRPCSLGKFNTTYIGGIAHELGHSFGLPHDCELDVQRQTLGHSLMGSGNHHYGENLRNEGPGTFLSASSALRLSVCRAFQPNKPELRRTNVNGNVTNLETVFRNGKLILEGSAQYDPTPLGIIVYNDNMKITSDYDAKTWVTKPDSKGNFRFEITELENVPYQMRLVFVFPGAVMDFSFDYSNESGTPSLEPFNVALGKREIARLLDQRKYEEAEKFLAGFAKKYSENGDWAKKLKLVRAIKKGPKFYDLAKLPKTKKTADLTWATAVSEKVGWHQPTRAILREYGFMEVDKTFFDSGIYAHSDSNYTFALDKKWKGFEFAYGLQNGAAGSVVFVVRGDNEELFRSGTVKSLELHTETIDVSGVDQLELITENAGDGPNGDWGLWLQPILKR